MYLRSTSRRPAWVLLLAAGWTLGAGVARAGDRESSVCVRAANDGQIRRDDGKLREARELFGICRRETCPKLVASSCQSWLADVDRRLPTVVLVVEDEQGRDLASSELRLDDELVASGAGRAIPVDPGRHVVSVRADGFETTEDEVVVAEGEKERVVRVRVKRRAPPRGEAESRRRGGLPATFWAAIGVSAIATASFGYFGLTSLDEAESLRTTCGPFCGEAKRDAVARTVVIADVSLVLAVVSLGGAAYIALSRR